MVTDMLSRRSLLAGFATTAAAMPFTRLARSATSSAPRYVGARITRTTGPTAGATTGAFVTGFDADGAVICDMALPARGHSFALHRNTGIVVAFARRPGTFAIVFDPASGRRLHTIEPAEDRRFCGHGLFARNGTVLIATELEYSTGDGVLGLYDANDGYRRIGEYRSGGLDPHETLLLPDGVTLVVANGGILTDPDAPGIKLNRNDMESSLAYVDTRDGTIVAQHRLPDEYAQLSLRHMALTPDGTVAVAMQYEGPSGDRVPLLVTHRLGDKALATLSAPDPGLGRLRNYCGSVAFDSTARVLAVTSPVGSVAAFWDLGTRRFVGVAEMGDVCGLAAARRGGEFIVTSGLEGAATVSAAERRMQSFGADTITSAHWDNHLLRIA
jgi:hypothetical protein